MHCFRSTESLPPSAEHIPPFHGVDGTRPTHILHALSLNVLLECASICPILCYGATGRRLMLECTLFDICTSLPPTSSNTAHSRNRSLFTTPTFTAVLLAKCLPFLLSNIHLPFTEYQLRRPFLCLEKHRLAVMVHTSIHTLATHARPEHSIPETVRRIVPSVLPCVNLFSTHVALQS